MKNIGKITSIKKLKEEQVLVKVLNWDTSLEENHIINREECPFLIGNIVIIESKNRIRKIFKIKSDFVSDYQKLKEHISKLNLKELIKFYKIIEYIYLKGAMEPTTDFLMDIMNCQGDQSFNVWKGIFLNSRYIANYFKTSIRRSLKSLSPKTVSFLERKDSELKDLDMAMINEILKKLETQDELKEYKQNSHNLYARFKKIITLMQSGEMEEYLSQCPDFHKTINYILLQAKHTFLYYQENGVNKTKCTQFYLEEIFIRIFRIDPSKAICFYEIMEELKGFTPSQYETAFLYFADLNFDILAWKKEKNRIWIDSYKKVKESNVSIFQLLKSLKIGKEAIVAAKNNIELYKTRINQNENPFLCRQKKAN